MTMDDTSDTKSMIPATESMSIADRVLKDAIDKASPEERSKEAICIGSNGIGSGDSCALSSQMLVRFDVPVSYTQLPPDARAHR